MNDVIANASKLDQINSVLDEDTGNLSVDDAIRRCYEWRVMKHAKQMWE